MPRYRYECPGGDDMIELVLSIHYPLPDLWCNVCGAKMRRVFDVPAIQFNAKDFYRTTGG